MEQNIFLVNSFESITCVATIALTREKIESTHPSNDVFLEAIFDIKSTSLSSFSNPYIFAVRKDSKGKQKKRKAYSLLLR